MLKELHYITVHLQQPPSWSSSILRLSMLLLPEPLPPGCEDMSLLYLLISRTMSKKALSTLTRVLADVSMNLQPKPRASAAPSV